MLFQLFLPFINKSESKRSKLIKIGPHLLKFNKQEALLLLRDRTTPKMAEMTLRCPSRSSKVAAIESYCMISC